MKLNAAKIAECAAWVEKNGLQPQPCGSTIEDFCRAQGIDRSTYYRWAQIPAFATELAQARARFASTTIKAVENALVKAAVGVDFETTREKGKAFDEVVREYDPATGKLIRETKTKKLVTVEAIREKKYYPPDVKAVQFVLTNLAPDKWKTQVDGTFAVTSGEGGIRIVDTRKPEPEAPAGNHAEPDKRETKPDNTEKLETK
jgi:hypothetical protein